MTVESGRLTGSRPTDRASVSPVSTKGFDPGRWMGLYCGLANARYALELWEREYTVAAKRLGHTMPEHLVDWCIERGRRECETLRDLEALVRPLACGPASAGEAGTATTTEIGVVHESAVPKGCTQRKAA